MELTTILVLVALCVLALVLKRIKVYRNLESGRIIIAFRRPRAPKFEIV